LEFERSPLEEEESRLWESALGVERSRNLWRGWSRALKEEVATRRKDAQVPSPTEESEKRYQEEARSGRFIGPWWLIQEGSLGQVGQ